MQQKQSLKQFLIFLSGIAFCSISSCASGPKVAVYISDPKLGGMEFFDPNTNSGGFVPYSETDKFVAFTPAAFTLILNYCSLNGKGNFKEASNKMKSAKNPEDRIEAVKTAFETKWEPEIND